MPCMCGDTACPSCGAAMGTYPEKPCELCGKEIDACHCPECPLCGAIGDSRCLNRCMSEMNTFIKEISGLRSAAP